MFVWTIDNNNKDSLFCIYEMLFNIVSGTSGRFMQDKDQSLSILKGG